MTLKTISHRRLTAGYWSHLFFNTISAANCQEHKFETWQDLPENESVREDHK
jgi:hypothetical protein